MPEHTTCLVSLVGFFKRPACEIHLFAQITTTRKKCVRYDQLDKQHHKLASLDRSISFTFSVSLSGETPQREADHFKDGVRKGLRRAFAISHSSLRPAAGTRKQTRVRARGIRRRRKQFRGKLGYYIRPRPKEVHDLRATADMLRRSALLLLTAHLTRTTRAASSTSSSHGTHPPTMQKTWRFCPDIGVPSSVY